MPLEVVFFSPGVLGGPRGEPGCVLGSLRGGRLFGGLHAVEALGPDGPDVLSKWTPCPQVVTLRGAVPSVESKQKVVDTRPRPVS